MESSFAGFNDSFPSYTEWTAIQPIMRPLGRFEDGRRQSSGRFAIGSTHRMWGRSKLATRELQALEPNAKLLDQLCECRRSQCSRTPAVARLQRLKELEGDELQRHLGGQARYHARQLSLPAQCAGNTTPTGRKVAGKRADDSCGGKQNRPHTKQSVRAVLFTPPCAICRDVCRRMPP